MQAPEGRPSDLDGLIGQVEELLPSGDARVRFIQYGGGLDECKVVANDAGYAQMGLAMLRAATAPSDNKNTVDVDTRFIANNSQINFDWFERTDDPSWSSPIEPSRAEKITAIVVVSGILTTISLAVIGAWTFYGWIVNAAGAP